MDEEGLLFITGRKKNPIVLNNGKNVYPEEIEGYLQRIPYIKELVVYSACDREPGEVNLCAEIFVEESLRASIEQQELYVMLE